MTGLVQRGWDQTKGNWVHTPLQFPNKSGCGFNLEILADNMFCKEIIRLPNHWGKLQPALRQEETKCVSGEKILGQGSGYCVN